MAKVLYDGNGNTTGSVPVDGNTYNAGDTVTVLNNTGGLGKGSDTFAYWNTAADGSGTLRAPAAKFTIGATDVTLFAQWYTTTSLTGGGTTTHYQFSYDSNLAAGGLEPARTNTLLAPNASGTSPCEADFSLMQGWFGNIELPFSYPVSVLIANAGGGAGWGPPITLKGGHSAANFLRDLMVAEVSEMFMLGQKKGWGFAAGAGDEQSCGEALSLFLLEQFDLQMGFPLISTSSGNAWLNSSLPTSDPQSTRFFDKTSTSTGYDYGSRADYINSTLNWPGNGPGTGGSILFLYYLFHQLGFTITEIIGAAPGFDSSGQPNDGACLRGVFQNLTTSTSDPFPLFAGLLAKAFPPDQVSAVPGSNPDDPWPLGFLSFWVDKSTFGKDEVQDVINTAGGKWQNAFWLVVEGFSKNAFSTLGVTIAPPSGPFALFGTQGTITISQSSPIDYENAAAPQAPQRIRIPFDITFASDAPNQFPTSGSQTLELDAWLTVGGTKLAGSDASTEFELVAGADPYFTNIDPGQNNVFYLSQDLRVFSAVPALISTPVAGGPAFTNDSTTGAFNYIQALLTWLNDQNNHFTDGSVDPFATGVIPQPGDALQGDSSVTPSTVDNSIPFFPRTYQNYNFAVARVRLRGPASGPTSPANDVRVFFRLWSTETADTDYQTGSTYPSTPDAAGQPGVPQVGSDHHTLPFFASGNLSGNSDYAAGGANIHKIQLPSGQENIWTYYGCFLNLYDSSNVIDGSPVQAWLNGTHHCIVAQIAFDDAPIPPGVSPESSDKLAQRNLQITHSDNPGAAATHRVPQTFDIRPSAAVSSSANPDELMIDWGATPRGSVASIYWPQVSASDVVALASKLYSSPPLSVVDSHTILCRITGGVTYLPIPAGGNENFAGLLTIDLPASVVKGQEFNIVVRRVSTKQLSNVPVLELRARSAIDLGGEPEAELPSQANVPTPLPRSYRYVVGTFQVKIPVTTADAMLPAEENTLAIMKWRLQQMAPSSRWYPVLTRYTDYVAARVDGLGGDSTSILPSPNGAAEAVKALRCRQLVTLTTALLALLIVVLGITGGVVALATVAALLAAALAWTTQCRPKLCDWIRVVLAGTGIGALVLAILALLGVSSPDLMGTLVAAVLLAVTAGVIGLVRGCF
jgi:hypothetical protein